MNYGAFGLGLGYQPPVKHKVFVSYHHSGDQDYYDAFSRSFHDLYELIYDNSLERKIDSDDVDYVMRRIRENFITGTSCTIVLVGAKTYGRKYVDWEIKATLEKEHGLIGIQLPTAPKTQEGKITVPDRLHDNIQSGFALWLTWESVMSDPKRFQEQVAMAKSKSTRQIMNTRERRLRNL